MSNVGWSDCLVVVERIRAQPYEKVISERLLTLNKTHSATSSGITHIRGDHLEHLWPQGPLSEPQKDQKHQKKDSFCLDGLKVL